MMSCFRIGVPRRVWMIVLQFVFSLHADLWIKERPVEKRTLTSLRETGDSWTVLPTGVTRPCSSTEEVQVTQIVM